MLPSLLCSLFLCPSSLPSLTGSPVGRAALNQAPDLPASSWGEDCRPRLSPISSNLPTMSLGEMNCPYGGGWGNRERPDLGLPEGRQEQGPGLLDAPTLGFPSTWIEQGTPAAKCCQARTKRCAGLRGLLRPPAHASRAQRPAPGGPAGLSRERPPEVSHSGWGGLLEP